MNGDLVNKPYTKRNPSIPEGKIFLAGWVLWVEWVDGDEPPGAYECSYVDSGWIRLCPVGGNPEEDEFETPISNIWKVKKKVRARA